MLSGNNGKTGASQGPGAPTSPPPPPDSTHQPPLPRRPGFQSEHAHGATPPQRSSQAADWPHVAPFHGVGPAP